MFSHLHVHSTYSFLDGASRVDRLTRRAAEHGFPSLAITDHGFVHAWPEFQSACDAEKIKPILGVEAYIVDDLAHAFALRDQSTKTVGRAEVMKQLKSPFHQILLAMDEVGVRNLTQLMSIAATQNMYMRRPLIDMALLERYSEGVIATSSCMNGLIPKAILEGDQARVDNLLRWYRRVFDDRFYFEVHDHKIPEEATIRDAIQGLAARHGIPVICANDVHYCDRDDYEVQKILVSIAFNQSVDEGAEYAHDRLHMTSVQEMQQLFGAQFPASLDETLKLADRCSGRLPFGRDYVLPHIDAPAEFGGETLAYIMQTCREALPKRYPAAKWGEAFDRLTYEITMLDKMQRERGIDFASYFMITSDMTSFARNSGIWVGPGRGSAAGSIVSYLLGITNIDPLRFNLLFERFINPDRVSMPDIDIDFQDSRRDEVLGYLRNKYGNESVMRIITFGTMGSKSVIRDLARTLKVPIAESDMLSAKVPDKEEGGEKYFSPTFLEDPYVVERAAVDDRVATIVNMGPRMFGLSKQVGVHPCGVVVTPGKVSDYLPICSVKARGSKADAELVTQFEGTYIDALGLLKLDVLGLQTGTIIQETIKLVQRSRGEEIDIDAIPLDDVKTLQLYCSGDTDGTFQFESQGMKEWLVKMQPNSIDDLVAMVALFRPGPMKLIPTYIDRKNGRDEVVYPHPVLSEALAETYGIAVYQEQVMQMARLLAGFSMGEADLLRRAIGKKKAKEMEAMHKKFVDGCAATLGMSAAEADALFGVIQEFANYGFNKSHAAAYALMAYQTAYLKANYPVEYMAVVVDVNASDAAKKTKYLQTCMEMGIDVRPPHINQSDAGFRADYVNNVIYYGLGVVKGVGEAATTAILEDRASGGPFRDLRDFIERTAMDPQVRITSGDISALIRVGAFDDFGERNTLLWEMDQLMDWARKMRDWQRGQSMLEEAGQRGSHRKSRPDPPEIDLAKAPAPMAFEERLRFEMDYLGQFISGHPMEGFSGVHNMIQQVTGARPNQPNPEIFQVGGKSCTSYVGYVLSVTERRIKSGKNQNKAFLVVNFMVGDGMVELIAWPEVYRRFEFLLRPDARLWVVASPKGRSSTIEGVVDLREVIADWTQGMHIVLSDADVDDAVQLLEESPGRQWTILEKDGASYVGPEVTLSPDRLRRLSYMGAVTVF